MSGLCPKDGRVAYTEETAVLKGSSSRNAVILRGLNEGLTTAEDKLYGLLKEEIEASTVPRVPKARRFQTITISNPRSSPTTSGSENFAFLILLVQGSIEYCVALEKSALHKSQL